MAELKTKPTDLSVSAFIKGLENLQQRNDCLELHKICTRLTAKKGKMWGPSMVGYGSYHYKYASGREGDFFLLGFAPRKQEITIYVMAGFEKFGNLLGKLGKFKTGKSCLYIKKLDDIDRSVLEKLLQSSLAAMKEIYDSP